MLGNIHSFESFGTKDGPGIRFILFLQGCPLRCLYCHNVDTWDPKTPKKQMSANDVMKEITKVKGFIKTGGVTISGGEPLLQIDFVEELIDMCKEQNIHTAIDTSGFIFNDRVKEVLNKVDLVLLDLKHIDSKKYKLLTGVELQNTLDFLEYLNKIDKKVWMRYVLVPGYSDDPEDLHNWAKYVSKFNNVERVDILPFHQMAIHKWENCGVEYLLKDTPTPTKEQIQKAKDIFKQYNI